VLVNAGKERVQTVEHSDGRMLRFDWRPRVVPYETAEGSTDFIKPGDLYQPLGSGRGLSGKTCQPLAVTRSRAPYDASTHRLHCHDVQGRRRTKKYKGIQLGVRENKPSTRSDWDTTQCRTDGPQSCSAGVPSSVPTMRTIHT